MFGEHGPRYHEDSPAHAKVWTPECTDADLGACTKESIINAYDNAVRYTDGVLAGLVKRLKARTDIDAGFVYVSDHGESLGEGGLYLHGAPYFMAPSEQICVPMVMWLSKDWSRTSRRWRSGSTPSAGWRSTWAEGWSSGASIRCLSLIHI